ncbi:MAG: hypothetical protein RBT65_19230 [Methanolobus sp.]|nr:hypothetical protein [Methanolobus sp.]
MRKPQVYVDENNNVTVVFGKEYESKQCNVTVVHDRGIELKGVKNFWGNTLTRYVYHCANAYGDNGYSSTSNDFKELKDQKKYSLRRK